MAGQADTEEEIEEQEEIEQEEEQGRDDENEDNDDNEPLYIDWCEGIELPSWVAQADCAPRPSEVWILEITDGGNPAGRVGLDRYTAVLGSCAMEYSNHCHVLVTHASSNATEGIDLCHAAIALNPSSCPSIGATSNKPATQSRRNKLDFSLIDLNSSKGTKLNGKMIQKGVCVPLKAGDKFSLGESPKVFRLVRGMAAPSEKKSFAAIATKEEAAVEDPFLSQPQEDHDDDNGNNNSNSGRAESDALPTAHTDDPHWDEGTKQSSNIIDYNSFESSVLDVHVEKKDSSSTDNNHNHGHKNSNNHINNNSGNIYGGGNNNNNNNSNNNNHSYYNHGNNRSRRNSNLSQNSTDHNNNSNSKYCSKEPIKEAKEVEVKDVVLKENTYLDKYGNVKFLSKEMAQETKRGGNGAGNNSKPIDQPSKDKKEGKEGKGNNEGNQKNRRDSRDDDRDNRDNRDGRKDRENDRSRSRSRSFKRDSRTDSRTDSRDKGWKSNYSPSRSNDWSRERGPKRNNSTGGKRSQDRRSVSSHRNRNRNKSRRSMSSSRSRSYSRSYSPRRGGGGGGGGGGNQRRDSRSRSRSRTYSRSRGRRSRSRSRSRSYSRSRGDRGGSEGRGGKKGGSNSNSRGRRSNSRRREMDSRSRERGANNGKHMKKDDTTKYKPPPGGPNGSQNNGGQSNGGQNNGGQNNGGQNNGGNNGGNPDSKNTKKYQPPVLETEAEALKRIEARKALLESEWQRELVRREREASGELSRQEREKGREKDKEREKVAFQRYNQPSKSRGITEVEVEGGENEEVEGATDNGTYEMYDTYGGEVSIAVDPNSTEGEGEGEGDGEGEGEGEGIEMAAGVDDEQGEDGTGEKEWAKVADVEEEEDGQCEGDADRVVGVYGLLETVSTELDGGKAKAVVFSSSHQVEERREEEASSSSIEGEETTVSLIVEQTASKRTRDEDREIFEEGEDDCYNDGNHTQLDKDDFLSGGKNKKVRSNSMQRVKS